MPMKYIKVYHDWTEATRMLKDAEKGRLIDAMVRYARGEGFPDNLSGNEQYVFPMFQMQLDRDGDAYDEISEKRRQAGAKGGKQKQANSSKSKQTQANSSKSKHDKDQDQDHDEDHDHDFVLKKSFDNHWRTSSKARAGVAQLVIDELENSLGKCEFADMHENLCDAMKNGVTPESILEGVTRCRNWNDLASWVAWCEMKGAAQ